ncbi:MAG: flagellar biosynthesis anti-sigma factor FlgM [Archangium sp.]|nr:flagellar biosynthesis anti-sigma factor FlgM [Archangium sp.]
MKVAEAALTVVPAVSSRTNAQSAEQKEVKDRVSFSTPQGEAAIQRARATTDASRAQRVEEVVNAVRSGQYYPSPQQIAQKLVSEAEVEAHLRVLLSQ